MGATEIDNMLMLLSVSDKMSEKERDIIMPLIIEGFKVRENFSLKQKKICLTFNINRIVQKKQVQLFKVVKLPLIHG